VLLVAVSLIVINCRQPHRWGTPEFNSEISQLLIASRCEEAVARLLAVNAREDPRWYEELIGAQLDCLAKKTPQPHYGDEVLALVNEGVRRVPKSSRLVFLRGFVNGRLGEPGVARRYYQDALDLANANIAADKGGGSAEDRRVAENARANLGAARRPGS
jgi:hypothetical protein